MLRFSLVLGVTCCLAACNGGSGGSGSGTDTETDSGTDSATDTDPTSTSSTSSTSGATGTSTTSTTGDTDSATDTATSTGTDTSTSTGSSGTSGSTGGTGSTSGTTGGGAVSYPDCDNGTCAGNEDQCIEESQGGNGEVCGIPCEQDSDCPDPVDGTALPECVDIPDGNPQTEDLHCVLDCIDQGQDLDCPTGMVCETIQVVDGGLTNTATCVWP